MKIYLNPTPLRQKFIEYLTLNPKGCAHGSVLRQLYHALAGALPALSRSTERRGHSTLALSLSIAERKQAPSTVNLAINAVRTFGGGLLQRDIELHSQTGQASQMSGPRPSSLQHGRGRKTPHRRHRRQPARSGLLSCVCFYGGGLRLSEATHIRIQDLDSVRHRLLVSSAKGGRQRYTLLSDNLVTCWVTISSEVSSQKPVSGIEPLILFNKSTGQDIFYGAVAKAGLPDRGGIHCLRHSFCNPLPGKRASRSPSCRCYRGTLHSIPRPVICTCAPNASLRSKSPLGLLDLKSPLIPA